MEEVHALPEIHHYWTGKFIVPLFAEIGYGGIDDLIERNVVEQCRRCSPRSARLVSLGAGNGDYELGLAARLAERGLANLELVLLELNGAMLERAVEVAQQLGLSDRVRVEQIDLNTWSASGPADVFLAVHSLHHVVELEHLYDEIAASIDPKGVLLVNDLIGRNGHMRWPEAAEIVRRIWSTLPERYRYNHYTGQVDAEFADIDCSVEGFEGIRAQDVLPLLLKRFHPELFFGFGNAIDPFVDRGYGHNFDLSDPEDTSLIDAIATLDEAAIDLQILTPTHLVASFRPNAVECHYPRRRSPHSAVHPSLSGGAAVAPHELPAGVSSARANGANASGTAEALEMHLQAEAARYAALRSRKAVRAALAAAELRHTVGRFVRRRFG